MACGAPRGCARDHANRRRAGCEPGGAPERAAAKAATSLLALDMQFLDVEGSSTKGSCALHPRPILVLDHLRAALGLPAAIPAVPARLGARHHPGRGGEDPLAFCLARWGEGIDPHPLFATDRVFGQKMLPWPG